VGKPGFPTPPPAGGLGAVQVSQDLLNVHAPARGRVWEGAALEQEGGETWFPHTPGAYFHVRLSIANHRF